MSELNLPPLDSTQVSVGPRADEIRPNGTVDIPGIGLKGILPKGKEYDPNEYTVVFHPQALTDAWTFFSRESYQFRHGVLLSKTEKGGMLVGRIHRSNGRPSYTDVSYFIPVPTVGDATNVHFDPSSWIHANNLLDYLKTRTGQTDLEFIGWAHTHPEIGSHFLSGQDQQVNEHFSQPGQIAMVMDPRAVSEGYPQVDIYSQGGQGEQFGTHKKHKGYFQSRDISRDVSVTYEELMDQEQMKKMLETLNVVKVGEVPPPSSEAERRNTEILHSLEQLHRDLDWAEQTWQWALNQNRKEFLMAEGSDHKSDAWALEAFRFGKKVARAQAGITSVDDIMRSSLSTEVKINELRRGFDYTFKVPTGKEGELDGKDAQFTEGFNVYYLQQFLGKYIANLERKGRIDPADQSYLDRARRLHQVLSVDRKGCGKKYFDIYKDKVLDQQDAYGRPLQHQRTKHEAFFVDHDSSGAFTARGKVADDQVNTENYRRAMKRFDEWQVIDIDQFIRLKTPILTPVAPVSIAPSTPVASPAPVVPNVPRAEPRLTELAPSSSATTPAPAVAPPSAERSSLRRPRSLITDIMDKLDDLDIGTKKAKIAIEPDTLAKYLNEATNLPFGMKIEGAKITTTPDGQLLIEGNATIAKGSGVFRAEFNVNAFHQLQLVTFSHPYRPGGVIPFEQVLKLYVNSVLPSGWQLQNTLLENGEISFVVSRAPTVSSAPPAPAVAPSSPPETSTQTRRIALNLLPSDNLAGPDKGAMGTVNARTLQSVLIRQFKSLGIAVPFDENSLDGMTRNETHYFEGMRGRPILWIEYTSGKNKYCFNDYSDLEHNASYEGLSVPDFISKHRRSLRLLHTRDDFANTLTPENVRKDPALINTIAQELKRYIFPAEHYRLENIEFFLP